MKRTVRKLVLTCLVLTVMCGLAQAQPANLLGNPGFELPDIGKYTNFDAGGPTPYWNDDGVNYTNTGIENTGAHSGTYRVFEMSGDDGAYQISTGPTPLNVGDQVVLTWWAWGIYNGSSTTFTGTGPTDPMQIVGIITATNNNFIQNDPFIDTTPVLVTSNGLSSSGWVQYTLIYTATANDAGKFPGVFFNTQQVGGNSQNSFAAYDDFNLFVSPAGSPPVILSSPVSQTAPPGTTVSFAVSALNATSYQWQAGATGSGVYTNLLNTGQFAGVTTTNLTITGVTTNNSLDYVVVASNGNGSVTSAPPANLTVAAVLYLENFFTGITHNQAITNAGWRNDIHDTDTRLFASTTVAAVYSYMSSAWTEAFYTTVITEDGSIANQMAFPRIDLSTVQNLSFSVDLYSGFAPNTVISYFAVQIDSGSWYVSTNQLIMTDASGVLHTYNQPFTTHASAWNQLTVSGTGSVSTNPLLEPVVGGPAPADLSGHITGAGLVCVHSGNGTHNFDNFVVMGAVPPNFKPVINAPPLSTTNYTGATVQFSVSATTNGLTTGLTYQWQSGTVGSGVYANLSNGGQFSGVTTPTLTIANVTSANHKDYVVIVTDGAGSVTNVPPVAQPATLTVLNSAPILTADTTITPNAIHAGNNNNVTLSATFVGNLPITYQWQFSPNPDGSGAVNIPGATTSTYALSALQTNNTGYYSLRASNSQSISPTNSSWAQLTVTPASAGFYRWSAPVSFNGMTSTQILSGQNGTFVGAEVFNGVAQSVTIGSTVYTFAVDGSVATITSTGGPGTGNQAFTGTTGDTNLDAVLTQEVECGGTPVITLNNLTIGLSYSVQLFAIDDTHDPSRLVGYVDPNDNTDASATTTVGSHSYILGFFTATNTTAVINVNLPTTHGFFNCLIVRTVTSPRLSLQSSGLNALLNWDFGTLLQATNITGPWTTNSSGAPYLIAPTGPRMFFRTQVP